MNYRRMKNNNNNNINSKIKANMITEIINKNSKMRILMKIFRIMKNLLKNNK